MAEMEKRETTIVTPTGTVTRRNDNFKQDFKKDGNRGPKRNGPRRDDKIDGMDKKLVKVGRVVKVTKGGKIARFNALMVVGDKNGKVGVGTGKALETPNAIEKAANDARAKVKQINLVNGTIPHQVVGKYGTSRVILVPAKEGTGVIAGGNARSVLEMVGIKNITCKSYGSRNKINNVMATLDGLMQLKNKDQIAAMRGKKSEEI